MILVDLGLVEEGANFLMSGKHIWLKMWAWGTWKGLGWSAIIYLAAISGIGQQLYEGFLPTLGEQLITVSTADLVWAAPLLVALGAVLSIASSVVSLNRYLKV